LSGWAYPQFLITAFITVFITINPCMRLNSGLGLGCLVFLRKALNALFFPIYALYNAILMIFKF
jgi:hypothetical protein